MPGRPRKPTKLHVLQGTARTTRHAERANEPVVIAPVGDPPEYIGEDGRREWIRLSNLEGYGSVLTAADRPALEHFCVLYQRFVDDAKGVKAMSSSDRQTYNSLTMQMGLTPAARSKVSAPAAKPAQSKWEKLASK